MNKLAKQTTSCCVPEPRSVALTREAMVTAARPSSLSPISPTFPRRVSATDTNHLIPPPTSFPVCDHFPDSFAGKFPTSTPSCSVPASNPSYSCSHFLPKEVPMRTHSSSVPQPTTPNPTSLSSPLFTPNSSYAIPHIPRTPIPYSPSPRSDGRRSSVTTLFPDYYTPIGHTPVTPLPREALTPSPNPCLRVNRRLTFTDDYNPIPMSPLPSYAPQPVTHTLSRSDFTPLPLPPLLPPAQSSPQQRTCKMPVFPHSSIPAAVSCRSKVSKKKRVLRALRRVRHYVKRMGGCFEGGV